MTLDNELPATGEVNEENQGDANSVVAALLAAGIGCGAMGVIITLSEALKPIADLLNLYKPVGSLSGKSLFAIVVWLIAWAALSRAVQGKQIQAGKWLACVLICVGIGVVATFPLFFDLFSGK